MPETRLFCTECWHDVKENDTACPSCGSGLSAFDDLTYDEKLMKALMHFEPQTAIRAAEILAMRKSEPGAAAIEQAFINRPDLDIFMGRAFLRAIGGIRGQPESAAASKLKDRILKSGMARSIIEDALSTRIRIGGDPDET